MQIWAGGLSEEGQLREDYGGQGPRHRKEMDPEQGLGANLDLK